MILDIPNRTSSDGISILGRKTPAYILEEVRRRQAEDRGSTSLWAKLAAEYGARHANFIVEHGTKFPTSRDERNRQEKWQSLLREVW